MNDMKNFYYPTLVITMILMAEVRPDTGRYTTVFATAEPGNTFPRETTIVALIFLCARLRLKGSGGYLQQEI